MVQELTPPRVPDTFSRRSEETTRLGVGGQSHSHQRQSAKKKVAVPLAFNPISRPNHTAPFIPAGVELSSFQHTHPPAEFSCNTATMAKSARSSQIKANNRRLKKNVFGPIEAARNERLSAKLQELIAQPKPEREVEVEMEAVDEGMLLVS